MVNSIVKIPFHMGPQCMFVFVISVFLRFVERTHSMTYAERAVALEEDNGIEAAHAAAETEGQSGPAGSLRGSCRNLKECG